MAKFNIAWLEEKAAAIDAADIDAAEAYAVAMMGRLGAFPTSRLLSIHEVIATDGRDDKPPTPFGRPPSGTLGGGQVKVAEALPDARAA
jgi:hypothetical protein